jgi:uncharacterized protein
MVRMHTPRKLGYLLLLLLAGSISGHAEKVARLPAPTAYVDDFANVMTPSGKAQVEAICREIHDKAKAQIFFVTINSLDGDSIDSFANDLFHNWKIGEKGTDRGILVLLAVKEHKRRIEVGYGFEGILPDAKAGRIGRDMVPALQTANYDQAALAGVTEIANVIADDAKVTLASTTATEPEHFDREEVPPPSPPNPPSSELPAGRFVMMLFPILFFGGFALFVLMVIIRKQVGRTPGGGIGFVDSSGSSSSGSSSSFSSDSSSSSDSFSGGDGGDSGGGGASGDW